MVLLWHGSGPNERAVLRPLAQRLADDTGALVLVPDWDSTAPDKGATRLAQSLQAAQEKAEDLDLPLVLVGWSLGGTAALSVALSGDRFGTPPTGVVGLAAAAEHPSPLTGRTPTDMLEDAPNDRPRIHLVHGTADDIVAAEEAERFRAACDSPVEVTLIDADHAGVVGTSFDATRDVCVPSEGPQARDGLAAAVAAVLSTSD